MTHPVLNVCAIVVILSAACQTGIVLWKFGQEDVVNQTIIDLQRTCAARLDGIYRRNAIADTKMDDLLRLLQRHDSGK